jgi:glucose-1-phosphate thymidylyltransferase
MKGIVLAGGTGSRLWPATTVVSKQLLPIYDKPMIYYPISTLMHAGIREILIITTPQDQAQFRLLLGDGSSFGVDFQFEAQPNPEGLAQAFIIGEKFISGADSMLILGDNIFHGVGLDHELSSISNKNEAHIFTYEVSNPSDYGVLEINSDNRAISIIEKPSNPKSNLAVTGLYYFNKDVSAIAQSIKPSARGELEITSIIQTYLDRGTLGFTKLSRGTAWLDTGNPNSLHDAASYIRVIEERTALKIGCLEEIAFENGWIDSSILEKRISILGKNAYSSYLKMLLTKKQPNAGGFK